MSASATLHPAVLALANREVDDGSLVLSAEVTDDTLVVHRGYHLRIILRAGRRGGFFRLPEIFGVQALEKTIGSITETANWGRESGE